MLNSIRYIFIFKFNNYNPNHVMYIGTTLCPKFKLYRTVQENLNKKTNDFLKPRIKSIGYNFLSDK